MTDKKNFNISDYLISHANLGKELNLNAFEAGIQLIKEKFFAKPLLETIFLMKIYFQDNWQQ
ncbi:MULTISPECIES: hypothetical protein [Candidatus Williamhamiltonella]|uniref:Uncharacterized protein n=1 Tax=Candidatus Williamhamiltonella defendens TaxID=138072 RepID=A0A2D3TBI3_9ENTR|nr:hypothetical protein [Candidatus Hamiltonella defensa]ATW33064.1 hypothetical protein BJP43_00875 [Candidatus Hamiltonella defensa]